MKKTFCDQCGVELNPDNSSFGYLRIKHGKLFLVVEAGHSDSEESGHPSGGDFCKYCVIQAFDSLDDRPKAAKAT